MADPSPVSREQALMEEITAPLARLPHDPLPEVANVEFPVVLRGYDRLAVDAYVKRMSQLVAELDASRSPQAAIRRALERVGQEVSGILQRAHETADEIVAQSRHDADDRLGRAQQEADTLLTDARREAERLVTDAHRQLKELDAETDRIWGERQRIVEDVRGLAAHLLSLAEAAIERFPAAEEETAQITEAAEDTVSLEPVEPPDDDQLLEHDAE